MPDGGFEPGYSGIRADPVKLIDRKMGADRFISHLKLLENKSYFI
jgi:hypothetical protein